MSSTGRSEGERQEIVAYLLDRVTRFSFRLRQIAALISALTVLNVLSVPMSFWLGSEISAENLEASTTRLIALLWISFVAVSVVTFLILWDRSRKRADAFFDEVSDLIQREYSRSDGGDQRIVGDTQLAVETRLSLKEYRNFRGLPLVPGESAPAIYFVVNVALIVAA
ncbi:MAG: hypothetical protein JWN39_2328, partial [Ilumatobacteraceae bacterium]|nr:hypothetical protein [Ilumatobacteraceae bacterium]